MNSTDAEVKCPFLDDDYQCDAPISEREIKQVYNYTCIYMYTSRMLDIVGRVCVNSTLTVT